MSDPFKGAGHIENHCHRVLKRQKSAEQRVYMAFLVKLQKFLNTRGTSASIWVLGGNIAGQTLRLIGNLILTRLLFPEAFGLMALVQIVIMGVALLSDVGFKGAVFIEKNSDDPQFLNTIWTLQCPSEKLMNY